MKEKKITPAAKKRMVSDDELKEILNAIKGKVMSAGALNGSFETLLLKVDKVEEAQGTMVGKFDKIEENQSLIVGKVDKIHDAIYHPDDGLFARIQSSKVSAKEQDIKLEKQITEKVSTVDDDVKSLMKTRRTFLKVGRAISFGIGGGFVTMVFKLLYDFVIKHVH
jgi:hypothetical protein